ncbi:MAG: TonB-dependent receptor plug domain-containing protein [Chitinophagales bacterium]
MVSSEAVVIATRAGGNSPTTFQLIGLKELKRNNLGQDLPYLLDETPALVTTSDAGTGVGYTGIRIRGTDASRINVTINDVPINDAESQQMYWVDMPDMASSAGNLQIQRGVGTSTNGSGAFGASVNVATRGFSNQAFGEWQSSFGSFSTQKHTVQAGTGRFGKYFFIEGRGSFLQSKGYVDRASATLWSYLITAGFSKGGTLIRFIHFNGHERTYQAWYGTPEDSLGTNRRFNVAGTDYGATTVPWNNQVDDYGQKYFQLVISQQWRNFYFKATPFATLGKGYYEEFKGDQRLSKYRIDSTGRSDLIRRRWLDNIFYGAVFSMQYEKPKKFQVTFGGMAARYDGKHYGTAIWARNHEVNIATHYYDSRSHKTDVNFYLKGSYLPLKWLSLFADLQYRFVEHTMKGNDNSARVFDLQPRYHFFNPKAGFSLILSDGSRFYASYAMANREPSRDDFIENLNTSLPKPERLQDAEFGFIWNSKTVGKRIGVSFPMQINGYYMRYTNQLVVTGELNDVGNPIRVNVPKSFRAGAEWSGKIIFSQKAKGHNFLQFNYNLAFNYSRILNYEEVIPAYDENYEPVPSAAKHQLYTNTAIAFSPQWVGGFGPEAYFLTHFSVGWNFKFVSRQFLDNTESDERSLKPYWYSNIRLNYAYPFGKNREVQFTVLLNNIFNRLYESNGYTYREIYQAADGSVSGPFHYNNYYPQAGFNFLAGIDLKF